MNVPKMIKAGPCAIAVACLFANPLLAKDKPEAIRLKPSSKWHVQFADDSCRLARFFGEGEQRSLFYIERYEPGDSFAMVVAGEPFKKNRHRHEIVVRFGSKFADKTYRYASGEVGEYGPALIFSSVYFDERPDFGKAGKSEAKLAPDIFSQSMPPEAEAAVSWIEFRSKKGRPIFLDTGSMGDPMKVLRDCTDDMLKHWGIDLDKHRNIATLPVPKGRQGRWVTYSDYPTDLLRSGHQGMVQVRLSVDAAGKPSDCHIQQSTRPVGFDTAVCEALMRRAKFEPAVTKDGEKIASFWRTTVRFQIL